MRAAAISTGLWATLLFLPLTAHAEGGDLKPEIRLQGRVFARVESSSADGYSRDLALPSARLSVEAKWRPLLRATVEADLADPHPLMDAYLLLKLGGGFSVRGGRFKAPFSARELTSPWKLPLIHRGLVNATVGAAGYGGRRLGAELRFSRKDWLGLEVETAILKGAFDSGEDAALRLSFRPFGFLCVGLNAHAQRFGKDGVATGADVAVNAGDNHFALEGLFAPMTREQALSPLPTLEVAALSGADLPPAKLIGRAEGLTAFASRRLRPFGPDLFLEPVLGAEWLRLPGQLPGVNGLLGVNAGRSDALRLQLAVARGKLSAAASSETRLTAQLGAHF